METDYCVGQLPTTVTSAWEETTHGEARLLGLMTSDVSTPDLSVLTFWTVITQKL